MTEEAPKGKYRELMESCPILYRQRKLPMSESCMCFGMECGEGWYEPLLDLSTKLETINLTLGKQWKFTIEAAQVKEKFGTLRFYYDIRTHRKHSLGYFLAAPFDFLSDCLRPKGGFRRRSLAIYPERKPSLFARIRFSTCYSLGYLGSFLYDALSSSTWTRRQETVVHAVTTQVDKMIERAEKECFNRCEDCGRVINQSWSPRCETLGWITYVCENCAKSHGKSYVVNLTSEEIAKFRDLKCEEANATIARNGKYYRNGVEIDRESAYKRDAQTAGSESGE